ncbi:leucine-rich repeat-containing protein 46-like isoform X1 [Acropora muricata]|uniref:leucine-rich repeat-containing protein 46-like isoform X1 n=1 Tax=Acropora muricata TaxID=159855 RepID=UPI0034E3A8F2
MESFSKSYGKCQKISVSLIAKRNLPNIQEKSSDDVAMELLKLCHVRLDREQIIEIDNLDCLGPVTNLYLQNNQIRRIENLNVLPNLKFLALAGNKIRKVENLQCLNKLQFLDLSGNAIDDFDADEFPSSLLLLHLKGNPCTQQANYKKKLLLALPSLKQLDGEDITREDMLEAGCPVERESESESESDDETEEDDNKSTEINDSELSNQGSLHKHCNDILVRAKIRTIKDDKEHKRRMDELACIREQHSKRISSRASSGP